MGALETLRGLAAGPREATAEALTHATGLPFRPLAAGARAAWVAPGLVLFLIELVTVTPPAAGQDAAAGKGDA